MVIHLAIYIWTSWLCGIVPWLNRAKRIRQVRTTNPKINKSRIMAIFLFTVFIVGCGRNFPTFTDQKISDILVCGAGLEEKVRTDLYAAWTKAGGRLGHEFYKVAKAVIFSSNSNFDKSDMYNSYINCILEIDIRNRKKENIPICLENCVAEESACLSRMNEKFRRCIADQMKGCYNDCRKNYGFSHRECLSDLCNWEEISKESRKFYERRCKNRGAIIDLESECNTKNSECRRGCTE